MSKRPIRAALAALALMALLGACSSGGSDDAGDSSDHDLSADGKAMFKTESKFARCMRNNGIDDFPDPQVDENEFILAGLPFARRDTEMNAAQKACQHIYEDAGPPDATGADAAAGWERVVPGGDCECADGSEFAFWERRDDPTKVVFFLDGGGSCFDAKTCAFTGLGTGGEANYDWSIYGEDPAQEGGIFDFARADNTFRDYSFIYVPSCTGDMHLGDVRRKYTPKLTVEHNGFVNGTAALRHLAENYPDASQVVVVAKGGVAAPLYGGLASDLLPDAQVTVLGAVSGHIPDDPDLNAEIAELWGAYANMPDWEVNEGLTARDWGPRRFWIQAGLHDPEIALARFDFAYDREAAGDAQVPVWTRRETSR